MKPKQPLRFPRIILIDNNENLPYTFDGIHADAKQGYKPIVIETRSQSLDTGDYTIQGYESLYVVERKSLADLFQTLGQRREQFQNTIARMNSLPFGGDVVIEAEWRTILEDPPPLSQLHPKSVFRTVLSWRFRFPKVHWLTCPGRRAAELATFRLLQRCLEYSSERTVHTTGDHCPP